MWLGEKIAKAGIENESCAEIGEVTIGGSSPAVNAGGEYRDAVITAPGGYIWLPEKGQEALLIACGDGTKAIAGQVCTGIPAGMAAGEVYIKSKSAAVYIRNNGTINISGNVAVSGSASIVGVVDIIGSLTINGRDV